MGISERLQLGKETARLVVGHLKPHEPRRYPGDTAREICGNIVASRWNGEYIPAGGSKLGQLWPREYGLFGRDIARLGHSDRLRASLQWALYHFERHGRLTTTLFPEGSAVDVYYPSADSLPALLKTMSVIGSHDLAGQHEAFLTREVRRYFRNILDPRTGVVRTDRLFTTPKDMAEAKGLCAANVYMLKTQQLLQEEFPGFENPVEGQDLTGPFMDAFWDPEMGGFADSLEFGGFSADANVLPYSEGVVTDTAMIQSSVAVMIEEGMADPLPVSYYPAGSDSRRRPRPGMRMHPTAEIWLPGFQTPNYPARWPMIGLDFIALEHSVDPERAAVHLQAYEDLVMQHGTLPEVFERDGRTPLRGRLLHRGSEFDMVWSARLATLIDEMRGGVEDLSHAMVSDDRSGDDYVQ